MKKKNIRVNHDLTKKRVLYLLAIIGTIIAGLASRNYSQLLPVIVAEQLGDMLWTMMVYYGFRLILIRKKIVFSILFSFLFSFGIEFSQLYQEQWINQIRNATLGGLILGKGFLFVDLLRYTVGIMCAFMMDYIFDKRKSVSY
ncbi:DUF2809 domain-containing protein [Caldibacillus lycopersici]|uniref:DUF2809 domain-containing protein n=1 Tax=Perspicuibacillus lycopersici TaxID=1325689 RepID=A0AAE3IWL0_9BACI|nr:DUF2809 domain-containing protein [Perspicuibacillus lycopersici]MCU9614928.1 DUF2809 domain-containing protein [Perspicuibacillus lycopersici]